jgi:RimJ/RimL family protein N-acetyltransferase
MPELPDSLTLRDDRVALRDWRFEDAPVLASVSGDPDVCRFTTVPWTYSERAARAWVQRQHEHRVAGTALVLAVTVGEEQPATGAVNLGRFSDDGREAELGYWLCSEGRGRGLATRSARLLCRWAFSELGLARIEIATLPENTASQRVAERLGATREGLRRASHRSQGRDWDMLIYALTLRSSDH